MKFAISKKALMLAAVMGVAAQGVAAIDPMPNHVKFTGTIKAASCTARSFGLPATVALGDINNEALKGDTYKAPDAAKISLQYDPQTTAACKNAELKFVNLNETNASIEMDKVGTLDKANVLLSFLQGDSSVANQVAIPMTQDEPLTLTPQLRLKDKTKVAATGAVEASVEVVINHQ